MHKKKNQVNLDKNKSWKFNEKVLYAPKKIVILEKCILIMRLWIVWWTFLFWMGAKTLNQFETTQNRNSENVNNEMQNIPFYHFSTQKTSRFVIHKNSSIPVYCIAKNPNSTFLLTFVNFHTNLFHLHQK